MSDPANHLGWLWSWTGQSFGYRDGDDLWTHDGHHVGRFDGSEIYGPEGYYLGELMGSDRLITARSRLTTRRAQFTTQPSRAKLRRRGRVPGYTLPTGYADFAPPKQLP